MPASTLDSSWLELLDRMPPGDTLEIGIHPGKSEEWRASEHAAAVSFARAAQVREHRFWRWSDLQ
jgi:hypothetical protein